MLEDGTDAGTVAELPPDLPIGLHALVGDDGATQATVLAGPGRCHLPDSLRTWGLVAQVPTARSRGSWGIGDLADVRALATWVAAEGGGALGAEPPARPHAGLPHPDEPLLPVEPPLAQPAAPPRRRGAGRRG